MPQREVLGVTCWVLGGGSLPQALHVRQGKLGLPQADVSLSQAVTVRATGDEQVVLCGRARQGENILDIVGRVEDFDPLKTCFDETGQECQSASTRMGENRDSFRLPDDRNGLPGGQSHPFDIR